ncbi:hypothetical protein P3W45_000666 [Vairimorpha bombi]
MKGKKEKEGAETKNDKPISAARTDEVELNIDKDPPQEEALAPKAVNYEASLDAIMQNVEASKRDWPRKAYRVILNRWKQMPRGGWTKTFSFYCEKFNTKITDTLFKKKAKETLLDESGRPTRVREFNEEEYAKRTKILEDILEAESLKETATRGKISKIFNEEKISSLKIDLKAMEYLNDSLLKIWEEDRPEAEENYKEYIQEYNLNLGEQLIFPTEEEFINIIKTLPNWKAAGPDRIFNFFIKNITSLNQIMYKIISRVCLSGSEEADKAHIPIDCIVSLGMCPWIANFLRMISSKWNLEVRESNKILFTKRVKRGILQGASLSPLLFVLCLEPLSKRLNEIYPKVEVSMDDKNFASNHLLFIDDLKLLPKTEEILKEMILNGRNLIAAINQHTISLINYYIGILNIEPNKYEEFDERVRLILIKHPVHQQHACKERLYLPRKALGRGLVNIELKSERMLLKLFNIIENSKETCLRRRAIFYTEN